MVAALRKDDTTDKLKLHIATDPAHYYGTLLPDLARDGGTRWQARCPLHADSNPSLKVFAKDAGWKCFSCREGGDFLALVRLIRNCSFPEAVEQVQALVGMPDERPRPQVKAAPTPTAAPIPLATVEVCHQRLLASGKPLAWLQERKGLTLEIIRTAQIGLSPDHWPGGTRYTIPSPFADGREEAVADLRGYRPGAANGKVLPWSAGRGNRLFPWPWVCGEPRIVCCEGEVDTLGLLGRGVPAVTAHCGVDGFLAVELPSLTGKQFMVLGDHDEAGDRLRADLPGRLYAAGAAQVTVARWPSDSPKGFDVADWLATQPTDDEVREVLHRGS